MLSCMTSRDDVCATPHLILHELTRSIIISWGGSDWTAYSSSKHQLFAQLHSRLHSPPPAPSWPLDFHFTLQPGSPPPSLFKTRPTIIYVFAGDIDWLHIDTSLLLASPAPAKNVIFLKEMASPAAADVVLFSCRCSVTLEIFLFVATCVQLSHLAQIQRGFGTRPVQAATPGSPAPRKYPSYMQLQAALSSPAAVEPPVLGK
jgi:hypothetical protein